MNAPSPKGAPMTATTCGGCGKPIGDRVEVHAFDCPTTMGQPMTKAARAEAEIAFRNLMAASEAMDLG